MKALILKPRREQSIRRRHPWVFSGAIAETDPDLQDGDRVVVLDHRRQRLAIGHFQEGSIRARLFAFGPDDLPEDFWLRRLRRAHQLRQLLGFVDNPRTNCYRLVHGEGDELPGLIIDIYGTVAVLQCHSIGMHREREHLARALVSLYGPDLSVYDKSREALPERYGSEQTDDYLIQAPGRAGTEGRILENGNAFFVDWAAGQKTGFFLDQRENRALLAQYAAGKSVLNTFCYTGGFSVYGLQGGAKRVDSVDVSARAMAMTARNVAEAGGDPSVHRSITADVMNYLKQEGDRYDLVVVDPPAFAKSQDKRHRAVQAYKRLNALAIDRVAPGGLLFTFSCSQVVDRSLFYNTIVAAGLERSRSVRVLHHLSQGPDHPVSLFHPEGSYLKGLVLGID